MSDSSRSGLIHAGANDGREYLADHGRRLVLIEPQRIPFARLQRNFAGRGDVTLIRVALGAQAGRATMHVAANDESSSLLEPKLHLEQYPLMPFPGREIVSLERLDDVMARMPGNFTDLVIDVQGYELEVLKGATQTLRGVRRITTEVNTVEMFDGCALIGDLDAFLTPCGFERTHTDLAVGDGAWGDAVYERSSNAIRVTRKDAVLAAGGSV